MFSIQILFNCYEFFCVPTFLNLKLTVNYYRKNYNIAYITQYRFVFLDYSVLKL